MKIKINISIDKELIKLVKEKAEKEGRSLSNALNTIVRDYFAPSEVSTDAKK